MGACMSDDSDKNSAAIDKMLKDDVSALNNIHKLLLLGAGESGKSTIAKQVKVIHKGGFSDGEVNLYRKVVHKNTIQSMATLLDGAVEVFEMTLSDDSKQSSLLIRAAADDPNPTMTDEISKAIKYLWNNEKAMKDAWKRVNELQIIDAASYYFDNIDRISADDYEPEIEDILRTRAKTTGVTEIPFTYEGNEFRLVDVGGQRSERRKWLNCFQEVTAVIFCVAMSEYNQQLYEDHSVNRIQESLQLFEETVNSKWFGDVNVLLFLNKADLFKEKIAKIDMTCAFPDYDGGCDYEAGCEFLERKFRSVYTHTEQEMYVHITCATNIDSIRHVMNDVGDIMLKNTVKGGGV